MQDCGELRNENASRRLINPRPGRNNRRWTSERGKSYPLVMAAMFTLTVGTLIFTELGKGLRQKVTVIVQQLLGQTPAVVDGKKRPTER